MRALPWLAAGLFTTVLVAASTGAETPGPQALPAILLEGTAEPTQIPCSDPRGCPDLTVDPETFAPRLRTQTFKEGNCAVVEGMVSPGTRTLLKFTFTTPNLGPGDLIVGNPNTQSEFFEFSGCHGHFHFKEYADYRLWTPSDYAAWDALRAANPDLTPAEVLAANPGLDFVRGDKRGFCVIDIVLYEIAPPKYLLCDFQGISVGWADEYSDDLDGQWIDVTGVAHGTYVLEQEVNPERLYEEADYANNRAAVTVTI